MAYFALQVVTGREMVTKNAIEIAARKHNLTEIKEVIVPAKILLDLSPGKRSKTRTLVAYNSYVFLNIETNNESSYQEMSGNLFRFLKFLPGVCHVIPYSVDKREMEELIGMWDNQNITELVTFKIDFIEEPVSTNSIVTKTQEFITKKKILNDFKRFIQLVNKTNKLSSYSLRQVNKEIIITAPLIIIFDALAKNTLSMSEFFNSPYKLLQQIMGVCNETTSYAF